MPRSIQTLACLVRPSGGSLYRRFFKTCPHRLRCPERNISIYGRGQYPEPYARGYWHTFWSAKPYHYLGEVCEIAGVADTGASDWDKEAIVRYMASNLTTKSNIFSIWGVAQTVKKNPANSNPANQGIFETRTSGASADDIITGEKRFQAVVERYVWPGNDGIPGQGHVTSGSYDQLSTGRHYLVICPVIIRPQLGNESMAQICTRIR